VKIPRHIKVRHRRFKRHFGKQQGRRVWVDLRRENVLQTLLHEVLHARHPKWSENHVLREEYGRWRRISDRDLVRLARLLGKIR
jgi:hypothetical protein